MQTTINHQTKMLQETDLDKNLLDFLREDLDFTGTKRGCGIGTCGACTVLVNNVPTRSCRKQVKDIVDKEVLTVEGLSNADGSLHLLQQAFIDCGAVQCGFCTPGMILTAYAFLLTNPHPTRAQIRSAIRGNLCRCTGYQQIVDAIWKYATRT
ncbi:MAG: (2Fe-2S)-binding protein [Pseudomonadota bacterium]|nr:(2Fe-2S)-binding protein [Gammaproteobacteria bacterium]MBU1558585.1 (2Fe-2S)-binding protein [Gammaproteobacteria bacterium]MBU1629369.1 (2Fe-2S)-binding protein [Gammaproteobacteria bacterium]MBU1926152.1 (2Fe-2S)-binding protein [Gammaproteobacteria bacterium]MBU2546097.1 (2Fe-2S)-binding protein [Gammaproteobacteria bacterium]